MSLCLLKRWLYEFTPTALITLGLPLLTVWPTLTDPHWGIYDDGATLKAAQLLQMYWRYILDAGSDVSGRYRPAYYLYYALQYTFFGTEVRGYYLVQALVLILTNWVLYAIVTRLTDSRPLGWFAVLIFLTSSTVAENYYTLSKAEPRLVLFLLVSLYCFLRVDRAAQWCTHHPQARRFPRPSSIAWATASGVSLMLAALTKETALIVLPAVLWWAVLAFGLEYRAASRTRTAAALTYCGLNVLIIGLFALAAYVFTPTPFPWAGSYTGSNLSFASSLNRLINYLHVSLDVFLLVGLAMAGAASWLLLRPRVASPMAMYALLCVLCAGAYAGLFVFAWRWQLAYYLLPIAAWLAIAISLLIKTLRIGCQPWRGYSWLWLIFILPLAVACAYSIPVLYNGAVALKIWHGVNAQMMHWLAGLPKETRVFFLSLQDDHEYLYQIKQLLEMIYHRSDILLSGVNTRLQLLSRIKPGDMIVSNFGGSGNRYLWVRGVQGIAFLEDAERWIAVSLHNIQLEEAFRTSRQRLVFQPFTLASDVLVLGWVGYRITTLPHVWLTTYDDGWVGREAELWLADEKLPATVLVSGQAPPTLVYPMHLEIWGRSGRLERFPIWSPGAFELRYRVEQPADAQREGYFHFRLVSDKTFIPTHIYGGIDSRELSVHITGVDILEEPGLFKE
jgi:Dolichyl-phosphate-mannose-protein mannosyltransferase